MQAVQKVLSRHCRLQLSPLQSWWRCNSQDEPRQPTRLFSSSAQKVVEAIPDAITKNLPHGSNAVPMQRQDQPGHEAEMTPKPEFIRESYQGSNKLKGKVAVITGGDSGIGRSVAVHFAREGANVAILYLDEHEDAEATRKLVEAEGRHCITVAGDVGKREVCKAFIDKTINEFGQLDIVVNNAAEQHYRESIEMITDEQLERTFKTNIFGQFYMVQAAMKHLKPGAAIINTASVTAYQGMPQLLDYSSTKGAIVAFTRSLAKQLVEKGIRVNAVAPGPIWTPLIPATFPKAMVATWQNSVPMQRAGQPSEVGPCYVFLASEDGSYFSGQVLHPNGGTVING